MPKLTKTEIDAAEPRERDYIVWDDGLKGFGLRVWPSGKKAFFVQYRDAAGSSRRYNLGIYGPTTPDAARKAAMHALADGRDAQKALHVVRLQEREKAEAERLKARAPTVLALADIFLDRIATRRRPRPAKPRTIAEYRRLVDQKIAPKIGDRPVTSVDRGTVERLLDGLKSRPALANNVHALLRAMFQYAERRELRKPGTNPCVGWERHERQRRGQSLTPAQYAALGAALDRALAEGLPVPPSLRDAKHGKSKKERERATGQTRGAYRLDPERPPRLTKADPVAVDVLRFLALSGWREGEALGLRRDAVDDRLQVARLAETKTGYSVRPLGSAAMDVLRAQTTVSGNPYVFVGRIAGEHVKEVKRVWMAAKHAAGLAVRLHDLRHSFTSVGRELNYTDNIIAGLVGHKLEGMTSRYGDVPEHTLRDAADRIAETIHNRLTGRK